jgi:chitodextrinase
MLCLIGRAIDFEGGSCLFKNVRNVFFLLAVGVIVSILFIPFDKSYAASGGYFDGKSVPVASGSSTTKYTDDNISTTGNVRFSYDVPVYKFSSPVTIDKIYYHGDNRITLKFYSDANATNLIKKFVINTLPSYPQDTWIDIQDVSNVMSIKADTDGVTNDYILAELDFMVKDTVPPAIPSGLVATGGNGSVTLDWNDNTESDLQGYNVYQSTDNITFTKVNSSLITTSNYTVTGLTNGTLYYFVVTAVDQSGNESARSATAFVTPSNSDTVPPAEVTNLRADVTDKTIKVTFTNPIDSDFAYANIYLNGQLQGQATNGSFTLNNLSPDTQYSIKVTTVDTSANESAGVVTSVKTASVVDTTPPDAPTGVQVSAGNGSAYVVWSANTESDLKGYNIYVDGVKVNSSLITGTAYTLEGLTNGRSYSIEVSAVDTAGNESVLSSAVSVIPTVDAMPLIRLGYSLVDVAHGTSEWFGSIWLLIAFATSIPLAFYIGNRTKLLFLD